MENIIIESNQNKIIKEVNALKAKKERDKTGLFILEGKRLVDEIPNSWEIKYLLKAESYSEDINFENVYTVKDSLFEKISEILKIGCACGWIFFLFSPCLAVWHSFCMA